MNSTLRACLLLTGLTLVLSAVVYPLAILGIGQVLFPTTANGNLAVDGTGKTIGSHSIAQEFKNAGHFHSRPSAAGENGYNAAASGASNLAASNPKLRERVVEQLKAEYPDAEVQPVPSDAVTTSASGLDPHITVQNAMRQVERIATKRAVTPEQISPVAEKIRKKVQAKAFIPTLDWGGEALVNVLELNLELDAEFGPLPAEG